MSCSRVLIYGRRAALRNPLGSYNAALTRSPLLTKCMTCAVGMSLGDIIAQVFSNRKSADKKIDMGRVLRSAIFGGMVNGPLGHVWYRLLDYSVFPVMSTHPMAVLTKCALDQLIMAPTGTALFLCSMKLMQRRPHECVQEVKQKTVPTLMSAYKLWPAAHVINFAFVPSEFRILYINIVAVVWSVILIGCTQTSPENA